MKKIGSTNRYEAFADSQTGGRSENQDFCDGFLLDSGEMVLTVCDGMGGSVGGSTASRVAADAILESLKQALIDRGRTSSMEARLHNAIEEANMAVYNCAINNPDLLGMGTTTVTLLLTDEAAYIAHVGDSRAYRLHNRHKLFRTFDHSYVMENFVRTGLRSEEWARTAPNANIITRALGLKTTMPVDIQRIPYRKGDRFVLCCDGVWNAIKEPQLLSLFSTSADAGQALSTLMSHIDEIGKKSGKEYDNFTAIMVDIKSNSKLQYSWCYRIMHKLQRLTCHK